MGSPNVPIQRKTRGERRGQVIGNSQFVSFEAVLLGDAERLMNYSMTLRASGHILCVDDNHFCYQAPTIIILTVTALDAWLNEIIYLLHKQPPELVPLIWLQEPTLRKCELLLNLYDENLKSSVRDDLIILLNVRDDLVHFMPQDRKNDHTHKTLRERGMFIEKVKKTMVLELAPYGYYKMAIFSFDTVYAVAKEIHMKMGKEPTTVVTNVTKLYESFALDQKLRY